MGFLPDNYEPPAGGNYMKLATGKNRFRILGSAIIGNEFWRRKGETREPVRRRMDEPITAGELEVNPKTGEQEKVKHFWAFPVWNYGASAVQILELTQKTIQSSIKSLIDSEDWGDPTQYDILVTKEGSGLDTEYHVNPAPMKALDEAIVQAFRAANIDMQALFVGGDPFGSGSKAAKTPSVGPLAAGADTNGHWMLEEAVKKCAEVGITRPELIDVLKKMSRGGWNPVRDTPTVKDLIAKKMQEAPFGAESQFKEDEIPF